MKISAIIITLNEERCIAQCIDSLLNVVDEIIIVDSFSTDKTEEICKQYPNVIFLQNNFVNYGLQKQFATEKTSNNWVLSIDADECISKELRDEIKQLKRASKLADAYYIRFRTLYQNKILKFSGLQNEKHLRLFNKEKCHFTNSEVHEKVLVNGEIDILKYKIIHASFSGLNHHLEKLNKYTDLFAKENFKKGKRTSKINVVTKPTIRFLTVYLIKLGFLDGYAGFIWALMASYYSFLKYAKLYELQKNKS